MRVFICLFLVVNLFSCTVKKKPSNAYSVDQDSLFNTMHLGIKLYDLAAQRTIYSLNSHKVFIPASNTKLLTMNTALFLYGDSIPGWSYAMDGDDLYIDPQGDPTFLNPEFKNQTFFEFIKASNKNIIVIVPEVNRVTRFGSGWSWGTWQETYSPERSIMPIYGNMTVFNKEAAKMTVMPSYFNSAINQLPNNQQFEKTSVIRAESSNNFTVRKSNSENNSWKRPFTNIGSDTLISYLLLKDTLQKSAFNKEINIVEKKPSHIDFVDFNTINRDSLLSLMMKRSDNFLAEQILIMSSKDVFDRHDDVLLRNYIQDSIFSSIFVNAKWVDGSGLSRSNLISPDEFVNLLDFWYRKDKMELAKRILPHGDEGTLKGLYKGYENNIFAKTGTLSDHLGLSGYLKTKSGKDLAFSILINNFRGSANTYRKKIEEYLINVINTY